MSELDGRKKTWVNMQVEEESVKVGESSEDALDRSKWSIGVNPIEGRLR